MEYVWYLVWGVVAIVSFWGGWKFYDWRHRKLKEFLDKLDQ